MDHHTETLAVSLREQLDKVAQEVGSSIQCAPNKNFTDTFVEQQLEYLDYVEERIERLCETGGVDIPDKWRARLQQHRRVLEQI